MNIEFRPASADEMRQLGDLTAYSYAGAFGYGEDNLVIQANRPEWTLCAFDGASMVASYATIPFTARANGNAVSLGGVSAVATAPEYRRRGLLREITRQALAAQLDAGQSVAALWASQAAIYQRYGYTAATARVSYQIDSADVNLLQPADPQWTVIRSALPECMDDIKATYRSYIAPRSLYLHRSAALWQSNLLSETADSEPVQVAVCRDADQQVQGYVIYTLSNNAVEHRSRSQGLQIRELLGLNVEAYRALWAFLARHDLVGRINWQRAPLDDPLPELLAEPRMLHSEINEGVWLRIVDVEGAMAGRGYNCDGEIEFSVLDDPLTPWNNGSYRVSVNDGTAAVTRIGTASALTLSIKALASAWCGRHRLSQLASWGLLEGDAAAISRADQLLATHHAPHCPDSF